VIRAGNDVAVDWLHDPRAYVTPRGIGEPAGPSTRVAGQHPPSGGRRCVPLL